MSEKYKIFDQDRLYFVTFTVECWVDVFVRQMYKDILLDSLRYCQKEKGLTIYSWCLMSSHIHLIIGRKSKNNIEEIVRDIKKYTAVHICRTIEGNSMESRKTWMLKIFRDAAAESKKHEKYKLWQSSYHPIELSDNYLMDQKLEYIHENPVKEGIVMRAEDYLYSSAMDYTGKKGLLEIEFIE